MTSPLALLISCNYSLPDTTSMLRDNMNGHGHSKDQNDEDLSMLSFVPLPQDLTTIPWAHGGFSDIYRGKHDNLDVAVKVIRKDRNFEREIASHISSSILHEVEIMRRLSHPNVSPFLGLTEVPGSPIPALVSPWMSNGNIRDYLRTEPEASNNRLQLVKSVASGLSYLHNNEIVHGRIHGGNVLVDSKGEAKIADFGLATLIQDMEVDDMGDIGHVRWQAPELVLGKFSSPIKASDIYSFANLIFEIFSGKQPFDDLLLDADVVLAVYEGRLPYSPANKRIFDSPNADKGFWDLMLSCWSHEPNNRPQMGHVLDGLANLQTLTTLVSIQSHL